ncbi:hypothetical protein [Domibacillus mangrovi]|uniref:Uncharacterized protein n=1 Tax=Domibacillus mangrovi TaxID=1714354 RepID=A0A1Q5P359_9BACI|nr:hypothetical protein BLL40_07695 [Domibacillus mangrovi]
MLAVVSLAACGNDEVAEPIKANTALDLTGVKAEYCDYAIGEIDLFVTETEKFAEAVKTGDSKLAKTLYALARMHDEREEPIAEKYSAI